MDYCSRRKLLIAGPTGTGTTFLIGLMHRLGFHTGFTDEEVNRVLHGRGKGLEYARNNKWRKPWLEERKKGFDNSPHVIKQPIQDYGDDGGTGVLCDALDVADENGWVVEHLFLTIRQLSSIVESVERRMKTGDAVIFKIRGEESRRQRELLAAEGLYKLMCKLAVRDCSYTLIEFPRSVDDPDYCYRKLFRLNGFNHSIDHFRAIHAEVANREMVHVR